MNYYWQTLRGLLAGARERGDAPVVVVLEAKMQATEYLANELRLGLREGGPPRRHSDGT